MCQLPLPFLSPTLSVISSSPPSLTALFITLFSCSFSQPLFLAQQDIMREVQSGAHTLNSHGVKVVKVHLHDWLILVLLMVMYLVVYLIHPFHRFVGKDMMTDLKFPLKSVTVPFWAVPIYALVLPIIVFLGFYFRRREVYDLHHSTLGILFAVLITGVITEMVKNAVGRPRPDFFWRCFPDGMDIYDKLGNVVCHGEKSVIRDGYKSFPSGHASWSFAGLGFLSLYLSGKIKAFDRRGHVAKVCIIILPLLVASLVSITLLDDYFHHSRDVFAGGLLGLTVATVCYLQFFPFPCHPDGWGPYAYFRMLEELRASGQPNIGMDTLNVQQPLAQQSEGGNNEFVGAHEVHDHRMNEMEAGRR